MGFDIETDILFHHLEHFEIIDVDDNKFGKIEDVILSLNDFSFLAFISVKNLLEEELEKLGIKEKKCLVIPISEIFTVNEENKRIILKLTKHELIDITSSL